MRALMAIPKDVKTVRCLLWVVHQGQMSEQLYAHGQIRQLAAASQCGLVLASIQRIESRTDLPELTRDAALAGATGVSMLMERLAQDASHPELRRAPILFWGFSASAGFGTTFAELHPGRTIGFVRYHTHRRGAVTDLNRLKAIPALLVAGGKDQTAGVEDAEEFWKSARVADAPWTFAVEPEAPHSSPEIHEKTVTALTVPWMSAVLRQRLSDGKTLRSVSTEGAFHNSK